MTEAVFFRYVLLLSSFIISVHMSIPFVMNPGCDLIQCRTAGQPALFYANHSIDEDTVHILYSSFDELTISIIQMKKGHALRIDYAALFNKTYNGSISFGHTTPSNSFSLVLRRLLRFNDQNDTGRLADDDQDIQSYWLNELRTNIIDPKNTTDQPFFYLPLNNDRLTIDISYPGESTRDAKFPKMQSTPKSYFLNLALRADNYTLARTRFAFEFYVIQLRSDGSELTSSRFIDDHFTPGIFNAWQLKSLGPLYPSSMLWKPVVYRGPERSVENTTLMTVYSLLNNITLDPTIDRGLFNALYLQPYVSGFNISLGRAKDGFFTKSNYSFIQLTAGLDILELDSMKEHVILALVCTLALPSVVTLIAIGMIIRRQCAAPISIGYDDIDD